MLLYTKYKFILCIAKALKQIWNVKISFQCSIIVYLTRGVYFTQMAMAKQVSQETFDNVVKENMQEFDMSAEEAVNDATQQFESQVLNLLAYLLVMTKSGLSSSDYNTNHSQGSQLWIPNRYTLYYWHVTFVPHCLFVFSNQYRLLQVGRLSLNEEIILCSD